MRAALTQAQEGDTKAGSLPRLLRHWQALSTQSTQRPLEFVDKP